MLKLLIVDDEPIIRNGLRNIIPWEDYGYEICGEAEDGPSAVAAILELKPDLALLDLHLPGFSGLEVVKKIRPGTTHFLVLTGYTEFEYAKEAINLDVNGYIVKPIEETILIERIKSIANEIKREDPEEQRLIQFLEIMEGTYREENHGPLCFFGEYFQAAFVSEGDAGAIIHRTGKIRNFFPKDVCHIFPYKEWAAVLFEDTPEITIKHLLERLYDHLARTGSRPALALGSRCRKEADAGSSILKSCREAEELMGRIFFFREKKFLSLGDIMERTAAEPERDWEKEASNLSSYIQIIDPKKIRNFFRDLEGYFLRSGKNHREIRQECMALFIEVRNILIAKIPGLREMLGTGAETLDAIMKLRFLGDIIDAMTEASLRVSEHLPLLSADSSFQRIISYVKNNYSEDLRLETLGQLFNYNCAYLGKRFKEYTGKRFHTYLDILRIEAAKELLQTTGMKVYEISTAVGYTNTDYFYSKFKKLAGKSPLDFRKKEPENAIF